jgi:transcription elongation factor GreA
MSGKAPITTEGFKKLKEEIHRIKTVDRPAITQQIAEARAHGDLSENAEYHAAREKQSFSEGRLATLEDFEVRAEVIDIHKLSGNTITFGATVTLVDEETDEESTYQIVGEYEADLNQRRISIASPLARALISKKKGDSVEVIAPKGPRYYEILNVVFA